MSPRTANTLIIFVKAPRLGTVKTRLAAVLGDGAARRIYRRLMRTTLRRLGADRRWRTVLATTPPGVDWHEWPRRLERRPQSRGDLGARMGGALRDCARPRAVLVGTDIPGISAAAVARAFRALGTARFVFGPGEDGGYWLIGWRRGPWPRGALTGGVRWSSPDALADSVRSLGGPGQVTLVDRLADLDTIDDLRRPLRATSGR